MAGSVLSVNVARAARDRVAGPPRDDVHLEGSRSRAACTSASANLAGDEQADLRFHGGADKAVYAYAREDYDWWGEELGRPAGRRDLRREPHARPASTSPARSSASAGVSARRSSRSPGRGRPAGSSARGWRASSFPSTSRQRVAPAPTCACSSEGELEARATRSTSSTSPATGSTVGEVAEIYHGDRARCEELLRAPEIGQEWRAWVRERLGRRRARVLPG